MPKRSSQGTLGGVDVDVNNLFRPHESGRLRHVEANAAETEDHHVAAGFTFAVYSTAPTPVVTSQPH